jgi:hypothetical protein
MVKSKAEKQPNNAKSAPKSLKAEIKALFGFWKDAIDADDYEKAAQLKKEREALEQLVGASTGSKKRKKSDTSIAAGDVSSRDGEGSSPTKLKKKRDSSVIGKGDDQEAKKTKKTKTKKKEKMDRDSSDEDAESEEEDQPKKKKAKMA